MPITVRRTPAGRASGPLDGAERDVLLVLAHTLLGHGRAADGHALLSWLNGLSPGDPAILRLLAYACLVTGDHRAALAFAEDGLRRQPAGGGLAALHLLRMKALWRLRRPEEARQAMARYRELAAAVPEAGVTM